MLFMNKFKDFLFFSVSVRVLNILASKFISIMKIKVVEDKIWQNFFPKKIQTIKIYNEKWKKHGQVSNRIKKTDKIKKKNCQI